MPIGTDYAYADRGPQVAKGVDGIFELEKQFEDIDVYTRDWSDYLKGETITNAVATTDGIQFSEPASPTPALPGNVTNAFTPTTTTICVTGVGPMHWDITTTGGRTFREYFRWRRLSRPILGSLGGGQSLPGEDYR